MSREICNRFSCDFFYSGKCHHKNENGEKQVQSCKASKNREGCPYQIPEGGCESCKTSNCKLGCLKLEKEISASTEATIPIPEKKEAIAYVDGSFNKFTSTYGYGVVFICDGVTEEYFDHGNDPATAKMYQIGGEILASCKAIAVAKKKGIEKLTIYYDYVGIEKWITGEFKAKNEKTKAYVKFVRECGIDIAFVKVKAHSNDELNDRADTLAKKAAGNLR